MEGELEVLRGVILVMQGDNRVLAPLIQLAQQYICVNEGVETNFTRARRVDGPARLI